MTTATLEERCTPEGVQADLQRQPQLLAHLAENALTVAENLRRNYFCNTARFLAALRRRCREPNNRVVALHHVPDTPWADLAGEVVTFIDGGTGRVRIASQAPILLRVGSYCVRTGERNLATREQFGYYPVLLGDLEGGSKDRRDFPDLVRLMAELLGGLAVLERTPDLRVLMMHGPLLYLMSAHAGHTPFTEADIDLLLRHYAAGPGFREKLKEDFLRQARLDIYPAMIEKSDDWAARRLFEPLAWIAFLCRRLLDVAKKRNPPPLVVGVVEHSDQREFCEKVLLDRIFRVLRDRGREGYFNEIFGRDDLRSPRTLLDRLGYTDVLLLAMLLEPGVYSEPWRMSKMVGLGPGAVGLPDEAGRVPVDFGALRAPGIGFPAVMGTYVQPCDNTLPIRVEVFEELATPNLREEVRRVHLYSRLVPGVGFPVGLHVADRYARVPGWLTRAYDKLIRHHLGVGLQSGEVRDPDVRKLLVQALYVTQRDWLFRPSQ
jgi:hypothetical protein